MKRLASFMRNNISSLLFVVTGLLFSQVAYTESEYEVVQWTDLIPPMDWAALQGQVIDHGAGPDDSSAASWGSQSDVVGSEMDSWEDPQSDWNDGSFEQDAYMSALTSTRTVDKYNGKNVKLPGFIVPLEFDDKLTVTQFFLVPYFGACIHMPPPPPNQMVLVDYPAGLELESLYTPFWISGEMSIQIEENEMGTSAYAMQMDSFEIYDY